MSQKMNPEIKARWVAALRSGEYEQTKDSLHRDGSFCCLGVLCELYRQERKLPEWHILRRDELEADDAALPSRSVIKWAGITGVHGDPCRNPTLTIDEYCATLSSHNDGENVPARTFAEIADAIEEQL